MAEAIVACIGDTKMTIKHFFAVTGILVLYAIVGTMDYNTAKAYEEFKVEQTR